ncbi:MAG: carbonic anhydrase [Myxococcales bacterium]|nr:carbonic anhydrase [Myxococcales bacterium]
MRPLSLTLLLLSAGLLSCDKAAAHAAEHGASASSSAHGAASASHDAPGGAHGHAPAANGGHQAAESKLPVPFIGEPGSLDVAKGFMRAMLGDNESFVSGHPTGHFQPFVAAEKPRATLLACADSRVQANALVKGAENDLFTVRNLGNQFKTAEGSVLYGVEHLATSVLLILGHSGCGAVKAAMGPHTDLEGPIKVEIDGIVVPPRKPGSNDGDALTEAVVANVHDQVRAATTRFADRVREGRLVIVGAVYDFRNDLKQGFGRVTVVNVNGTSDPAAITAFTKAVEK